MSLTLRRCHVERTVRLNETRPLLEQLHARGAFRLQRRVDYQQPGPQFHTFAAGSTARRPDRPVRHLKSSSDVINYRTTYLCLAASRTPHLADRIGLLFRSCLTWRLHAFLLLDERHERTPLAAAAVAEPPRPHFQADPARARTLGPLAPFGGLAKRIVPRRDHVVVALLLAPEITDTSSRYTRN